MKLTRFKRLTFFLLLSLQSNFCIAHEGGHYHRNDGTVFNVWTLKSGEIIKGNFSSGNDNMLTLEQEEGKIIKVPLENLNDQDQLLARFKIKKFERMNIEEKELIPNKHMQASSFPFTLLLSLAGLSAILLFILQKTVLQYKRSKFYAGEIAGFTFLLLITAVVLMAFKRNAVENYLPLSKTSTGFIDSAFSPYKPSVSTRWDSNYFYISSNGIPQHNMMTGITSWQQQVPLPQNYTGNNSWSIPLQPVYADMPLSTRNNFMKGAVAIASNGIPIFNALNNRGEDAFAVGELDNWGGHCGRADDYHYHAAPLHLMVTSGLKPIAFALDGFAVYGSKEPDGSPMQPLDNCHGHFTKNGAYHYHGTTTYPYVIGAFKGQVNTDPATAAPENQILPQAFTSPIRPPGRPLRGATITAFETIAPDKYKLTYQMGKAYGYVEYEKLENNQYQFIVTDIYGLKDSSIYQQKNKRRQ